MYIFNYCKESFIFCSSSSAEKQKLYWHWNLMYNDIVIVISIRSHFNSTHKKTLKIMFMPQRSLSPLELEVVYLCGSFYVFYPVITPKYPWYTPLWPILLAAAARFFAATKKQEKSSFSCTVWFGQYVKVFWLPKSYVFKQRKHKFKFYIRVALLIRYPLTHRPIMIWSTMLTYK